MSICVVVVVVKEYISLTEGVDVQTAVSWLYVRGGSKRAHDEHKKYKLVPISTYETI